MEIRIEHLSMTYPSGKQALKDLDLELKAPSLIGLLGPNGAGSGVPPPLSVCTHIATAGRRKGCCKFSFVFPRWLVFLLSVNVR